MVFSETEWGLVGANRVKWEDHRQSIANKKKGGEGVIVILQSLRFSFFFHRNVFLPHLLVFATEVSCGTYNTSSWHRFWWWTPGKKWPSGVTDVLKNAYGTCKSSDHYCFQRPPSWAREDATELLAIDNEGTVYRWQFDSKNPTAHAVWQALYDHKKTHNGKIKNKKAWNPTTLEGKKPKATQDSFMYRTQNGVNSLLLDDDNCDCSSSLSMGHGMCNAGHSTSYSKPNVFGVDKLCDPGCRGPSPSYVWVWAQHQLWSCKPVWSRFPL